MLTWITHSGLGDTSVSIFENAHNVCDDQTWYTFCHWGQGPVYQAGTSQVHPKEMDSVPRMCPPGTLQIHPEFSLPISLQFPQPGNSWFIHSVPGHVTAMSPLGNI